MSSKAKTRVTIRRCAGELVGAKEAAEILGVERTRIARYQREGKMPPKVEQLGSGPVFLRKEVEKMAKDRNARRAERAKVNGR